MRELELPASDDQLDAVLEFISQELDKENCPKDIKFQIMVSVEEIFINIAHYAYHPLIGSATIQCQMDREPRMIEITFLDSGKPYDPLNTEDPDTSLSAQEREMGGLGIFMVKNYMDQLKYCYEDGMNKFKMIKEF
jgi:anti-sigma regulatory factor (Ser/Thr protein kinase)